MIVKLKSWCVNAALVLISIMLGVLCFEYYLAWDNRHPNTNLFTNTFKLNGAEYNFLETVEAVERHRGAILIAGDSFTAGHGCVDGKNYPSEFTKAAAQKKVGLHAVNMGVAGAGPYAYAQSVRDFLIEKGSASGAILTLYANDVEIDCQACRGQQHWSRLADLTRENEEELARLCTPCLNASSQREETQVAGDVSVLRRLNWWLAGRSLTYLLLRETGARAAMATGLLRMNWGRAAYPERWHNKDGVYFKYIKGSIRFARQEADRHGVPLMVVIYPDPINISRGNEYVQIYHDVSTWLAEATGVPVHSGYNAFLGNPAADSNMPFSLTDAHPSCRAHAIFGEWTLAKWIDARARGPGPERQ